MGVFGCYYTLKEQTNLSKVRTKTAEGLLKVYVGGLCGAYHTASCGLPQISELFHIIH